MSDHLDQLIRQAASAHLALAPFRVLTTAGLSGDHDEDDLVARALARLDDPDYVAQLAPFDPEALMMSEPDHDPDRDRHGGVPTSSSDGDDSGLHDIRALAQTAKIRISRKMPVVTAADEEAWASTTGQLKAIALPEPARMVMLPELPASADAELARVTALEVEARGTSAGATAAAAELTAIQAVRPRKRTGLWLGVAGVVAAAAVIVVVASGGGSSKKADTAAMAAAGSTAPSATVESAGPGTVTTAPAPGGASGLAAETGPAMGAGSAATATAARGDVGSAPAAALPGGNEPRHDKDTTGKDSHGAAAGSGDAAEPRVAKATGAGSGSGKEPRAVAEPKGPGDKAPGGDGKKPGAGNGEKSIDDLLGDATGGSKPPPAGGGATGPKLEKKGLDGKDIKTGMGAVSGKAQACFDQSGVAGYVKVKATVDPSGKVLKVVAVGEFAGTPTGTCVAAAVKAGASFPPWDGSQMTINYGYSLNE